MSADMTIHYGFGIPKHVETRMRQCQGIYILDREDKGGYSAALVVQSRNGKLFQANHPPPVVERDLRSFVLQQKVRITGPHLYYARPDDYAVKSMQDELVQRGQLSLFLSADHIEVVKRESREYYVVAVTGDQRTVLTGVQFVKESTPICLTALWKVIDTLRARRSRATQEIKVFWYTVSDENGDRTELCSSEVVLSKALTNLVREHDKRKAARMRGRAIDDPVWQRAWQRFCHERSENLNTYSYGSTMLEVPEI